MIRSIMTREVVTVGMDDTLGTIGRIFEEKRFHHVLVVEDDELTGVISDRDVLKASSPFLKSLSELPRDSAVLKKHAHQIMSRKPVTISPDATIEEAVGVLLDKNVSCLPVVSSGGQIEGIVTWRDLLRAYVAARR